MNALQTAVAGVFLHPVLQCPGLHIRVRAGQDIGRLAAGAHFPAERGRVIRHGDRSYGGVAFGRADHDPGAGGSGLVGVPQTLQCGGDPDGLIPHGNAPPLERTQLPDPHTGEQRQQYAEFACVHVRQQVRNEPLLLLPGQDAHLFAAAFGIVDLDDRKDSGEACRSKFQNAVEHNENVMHAFRGKLVLKQQFPCKIVDQPGGKAEGKAAAQLRLDVFFQRRIIFNVGCFLYLRFSQTQPLVAVKCEAVAGAHVRQGRAAHHGRFELRDLLLCFFVGFAVAEPVPDLAGKLIAPDIPGFPAAVLPFEDVFTL